MLITALILVLSVGATVQFAVLSWHAGVLRTVSQSAVMVDAASLAGKTSFEQAVSYSHLCPDLGSDTSAPLGAIRLYHRCLSALGSLRGSNWASREIALCTQYAQVALAQRVEHNRAVFSQAASF